MRRDIYDIGLTLQPRECPPGFMRRDIYDIGLTISWKRSNNFIIFNNIGQTTNKIYSLNNYNL